MRVVNFGSLNIDYVYRVDHFVRPGETVGCESLSVGCGGKGLNQSVALARAGVETWHAGFLGAEGGFLREKLESAGVHTDFLRAGAGSNGHAVIQVDKKGQNCILLYGGTNRQFTKAYVDEVLSRFRADDVVLLQNETNGIPYIMEQAARRGMRVAFNAAPMSREVRSYPLSAVKWLLVNEVEGGALAGIPDGEFDFIASKLAERYPRADLVLTLGRAGSIGVTDGRSVRVPARTVQVVDTTAAGDTFTGYFLRGTAEGRPMEECLRLAAAAAAIAVTRPGAADSIPAYEEVVRTL
jgi:ribokinase